MVGNRTHRFRTQPAALRQQRGTDLALAQEPDPAEGGVDPSSREHHERLDGHRGQAEGGDRAFGGLRDPEQFRRVLVSRLASGVDSVIHDLWSGAPVLDIDDEDTARAHQQHVDVGGARPRPPAVHEQSPAALREHQQLCRHPLFALARRLPLLGLAPGGLPLLPQQPLLPSRFLRPSRRRPACRHAQPPHTRSSDHRTVRERSGRGRDG